MSKLSSTFILTQVLVVALLGLVALPALFSGGRAGPPGGDGVSADAAFWLIVGLALSLWLLALAPGLASAVAVVIGRLEPRGGVARVQRPATGAIARLLVAVVDVAIVQAMLRQPVVSVLGVVADPTTVDVTFATGTLLVLILILVWLHRSARPLIEAAAWQVLDAVLATSGSEQSNALSDEADTMLATVPARTQIVETRSMPTRPAVNAPTATMLEDDATRPTPRGPSSGGGEATVAAEQTVADRTIARHDAVVAGGTESQSTETGVDGP